MNNATLLSSGERTWIFIGKNPSNLNNSVQQENYFEQLPPLSSRVLIWTTSVNGRQLPISGSIVQTLCITFSIRHSIIGLSRFLLWDYQDDYVFLMDTSFTMSNIKHFSQTNIHIYYIYISVFEMRNVLYCFTSSSNCTFCFKYKT